MLLPQNSSGWKSLIAINLTILPLQTTHSITFVCSFPQEIILYRRFGVSKIRDLVQLDLFNKLLCRRIIPFNLHPNQIFAIVPFLLLLSISTSLAFDYQSAFKVWLFILILCSMSMHWWQILWYTSISISSKSNIKEQISATTLHEASQP